MYDDDDYAEEIIWPGWNTDWDKEDATEIVFYYDWNKEESDGGYYIVPLCEWRKLPCLRCG